MEVEPVEPAKVNINTSSTGTERSRKASFLFSSDTRKVERGKPSTINKQSL
jgi:hypothetical protein